MTKHYDFEDKTFYLKPSKLNRIRLLEPYDQIEYRSGSLFGSLLIHDLGVKTWELPRER
ncbi:MAG: hypothetical protein GX850_02785 [Clostridiaceae bacterium]|nr:hypothetical protein [Clostridiaceae bacterium]